jgi:hypothetical protein
MHQIGGGGGAILYEAFHAAIAASDRTFFHLSGCGYCCLSFCCNRHEGSREISVFLNLLRNSMNAIEADKDVYATRQAQEQQRNNV